MYQFYHYICQSHRMLGWKLAKLQLVPTPRVILTNLDAVTSILNIRSPLYTALAQLLFPKPR